MGASSMTTKYYGIYCPQCNLWVKDADGRFYFYPAAEIANAHLTENDPVTAHLWQAQEFGAERSVSPYDLPVGTTVCPTIVEKMNQRRFCEMAI